ncbi:MAG: roadblock/LC7 domain-containing protein [candidate division WOR-3 bacterium]
MMQEGLNIFEDDFWAITEALNRLLQGTNARTILLIDKAGQLITSAGDTSRIDISSFATLSAADFAATSQLASLIGEKEFSTLFHQGEKENLYVCLVANRVILAVIFDQRTTLGLVRVKTKNTAQELEKIFEDIFKKLGKEQLAQKPFDLDFTKAAEDELDKLFGF